MLAGPLDGIEFLANRFEMRAELLVVAPAERHSHVGVGGAKADNRLT